MNQKNDPKLRSYRQFEFQNTYQCRRMPLVNTEIFLNILEAYQDFRIVGVVFSRAIDCFELITFHASWIED